MTRTAMKTPAEFVAENEGYAFVEAIEARDRQVRATALREAADKFDLFTFNDYPGHWVATLLRREADREERGE